MIRTTALLTLLSVHVAASAQSLPATVIARTGQVVPDVPGATFTTIGTLPRLGASGHVAFNSFINGVSSSTDFGYWVGTAPENLQTAIRENSANMGPINFPSNSNVAVDTTGRVSTWTALNVAANMDHRQFTLLPDGNGGPTLVAAESTTMAPGFAGGVFANIGSGHAANDAGAVAFTASVTGGDASGSSDFGLFAGTPDNLRLVAREGAAAPGASGTSPVFSTTTSTIFDKRINAAGQLGFGAALSGDGVDASNDRAIYVWTPHGDSGTLALAAQTGSVAPGTSATIKFTLMDSSPGFNDAGQVAFRSSLTSDVPGEITPANNYGIWAGAPESVQLIARAGEASPIAGLTFRTPDANPRINASGQVAFFTIVSGTGVTLANDRVLWVTTPSQVEAAVREGAAAPGTPDGVNFATLEPFVAINGPGQIAFTATLTGTGVTGANDRGLWAGLPGQLSLVAREGDVVDLDPGEGELLKTISTFTFANGHGSTQFESAGAAFNDAGQIAWQAQFTDATRAIFRTALPEIPDEGLPGDYNNDGTVDAGDYVRWRNHLGDPDESALHNNGDGGDVSLTDYSWWKQHYGTPATGIGGLASRAVPGHGHKSAIPEPDALLLALLALACCLARPGHPLLANS